MSTELPDSPEEAKPADDIFGLYGLEDLLGEGVEVSVPPVGDPVVTIAREKLLEACRFFKEEQGFDYLILVSGVDRGDHLESVIHLGKADAPNIVILKTAVPYDDPHVPSVTPLWQGANWHERESFDLMGIIYDGHPDLRRILLFPEWDEYPHPLRKEFRLPSLEGKYTVE
ncbi:MAG: NADH-quinone oxidoreductase subunit C [Armatimonadetes bacterium]|jgi:NADH-quinone oxidoreductase subunit C|nr:NADH-quinone oxidoreductase subunit C [Armatimonadota bacterium]